MEFLMGHCYWLLWTLGGLCAILFYLRHRKRIRAFLLGSVTGLTALVLLHFYGGAVGFVPTLCLTNLLVCTVFGIPGVALLALGSLFPG